MAVYIIGRDAAEAQIVLKDDAKKVSRRHAELHVVGDQLMLVDLKSANGTEILDSGRWRRIERQAVGAETRVRFAARHETSVQELLRQAGVTTPAQAPAAARGQTAQALPLPFAMPTASPSGVAAAAAYTALGCPKCGNPMHGERCSACGTSRPQQQDGIIGVIARDAFDLGNQDGRGGYLQVMWQLVRTPVTTTLQLANDANFKLHWALFIIGCVISFSMQEILNRSALLHNQRPEPNPAYEAIKKEFPVIGLFDEKVVQWAAVYFFFIFTFIISYSVFRDYSERPRSPRSYLRLSCVSSFVTNVMSAALLTPIIAARINLITPDWAFKLFLILLMGFFVFALQYVLRITTLFWNISLVSAARGFLISSILAIIVLVLLIGGTLAVVYLIQLLTGVKGLPS